MLGPRASRECPEWPTADDDPLVIGVVARRDFSDTAYGWALEDTTSFVKLIAGPATRRLLAANIIGPQAATLIQPLVQAIYLDNTVEQLAHDVLYIHPALTEVIAQTLLELPGTPD